ncbi:MAG: flagellar hook protein FlgE [Candidatus Binatia bacterium]
MAIVGALSTGRSGLINSGAALGVIGNNIANVSTVGFKGSRTEFADLISAEAGGEVGKIGLGSRIRAIRTLFGQGPVEATGRSLDMALDGQGFFVLREGTAQVFTRAGNFGLNPDGAVINTIGLPLQGFPLDAAGDISGGITDVTVAGLSSQAAQTENATVKGNVQSDADLKDAGLGLGPGVFDPTNFQSAFDSSNFTTTVQVYDSLGQQHDMTLFFTKTTTAGQWTVNAGVDDGDVTGGTAGNLNIVGSSTLVFSPSGGVTSGSPLTCTIGAGFTGATAGQAITVKLDEMKQLASPSGVNYVIQDGFGAGGLTSLSVDAKGVLSATFDNGQTRPLYQLGIARFAAPEGLAPAGNATYRATIDSGPAAIATAQAQGNGSVVASALEQSNVQIAQEFIDLISQQRSFQANARVISASDSLLGDLINIIR